MNQINEQRIIDLEKRLLEAMKQSNIQVLDELLHEDLLFVLQNGEVITKQMDLETHRSGHLVLEDISSTVDSVKLIGENAVVTLQSSIKGSMMKQSFEGRFRYLRVWKISGDQFKVIAGSCVAI